VYAEAAAVCLSRHHQPPVEFAVMNKGVEDRWLVDWSPPSIREQRSHANVIDATEDGAYGVSLAAVESVLGLFVVGRADNLTGADWLVAPAGEDSLENARRLEVSGVDHGQVSDIQRRVRVKEAQVTKPSDSPWLVSIVGFKAQLV